MIMGNGKTEDVQLQEKTQLFQRAVMFSLLNPQPDGACFVGFNARDTWDLGSYSGVELRVRSQGNNSIYKVNLRHNGQESDGVSYEAFYEATQGEWTTVFLSFTSFKPYYRGQLVPDVDPLNTSNITTVILQIVGGVYSEFKQRGTSSLEIDYIQAVV